MRDSSVAANSEDWITPLTSRGRCHQGRGFDAGREALGGFLDHQALEVAVVVGAPSARSAQQAVVVRGFGA
jgi:hypothetical protein